MNANIFLLLNMCFWCSIRFVHQCEFIPQITGDQICVILDQLAVLRDTNVGLQSNIVLQIFLHLVITHGLSSLF